jgi:hypothetical protein
MILERVHENAVAGVLARILLLEPRAEDVHLRLRLDRRHAGFIRATICSQ